MNEVVDIFLCRKLSLMFKMISWKWFCWCQRLWRSCSRRNGLLVFPGEGGTWFSFLPDQSRTFYQNQKEPWQWITCLTLLLWQRRRWSPEKGSESQGHTAVAGPCSCQEWAADLPHWFLHPERVLRVPLASPCPFHRWKHWNPKKGERSTQHAHQLEKQTGS